MSFICFSESWCHRKHHFHCAKVVDACFGRYNYQISGLRLNFFVVKHKNAMPANDVVDISAFYIVKFLEVSFLDNNVNNIGRRIIFAIHSQINTVFIEFPGVLSCEFIGSHIGLDAFVAGEVIADNLVFSDVVLQ